MSNQWKANGFCDGGDLDCGSGLLLIIKKAMDPISNGGILEIRSRESSVAEDLPAWCRMVGHEYLGSEKTPSYAVYFVRKNDNSERQADLETDLEAAKRYQWTVRIRGKERLVAQVYARNHSFIAGQPADFGALVEAPSGVDFLLAALGSDLVVGLKSAASRSELLLDEVELTLLANLNNVLYHMGLEDGGTPVVERISGVFYVATTDDEDRVRLLWQQVLNRSPMYQTLKLVTVIDIRFEVTF